MSSFGHVLTLIGFVFAFSVTHILACVGRMVRSREHVRFSGLLVLGIGAALLLVYVNWLAMWELRDGTIWGIGVISALFLFSLSACFVCIVSAPDVTFREEIDLNLVYERQRKVYFWAWLVCQALAVVTNVVLAEGEVGAKLMQENLLNFMMFPLIILALIVDKRWAQWTGLTGLVLLNLMFLLLFERRLD